MIKKILLILSCIFFIGIVLTNSLKAQRSCTLQGRYAVGGSFSGIVELKFVDGSNYYNGGIMGRRSGNWVCELYEIRSLLSTPVSPTGTTNYIYQGTAKCSPPVVNSTQPMQAHITLRCPGEAIWVNLGNGIIKLKGEKIR